MMIDLCKSLCDMIERLLSRPQLVIIYLRVSPFVLPLLLFRFLWQHLMSPVHWTDGHSYLVVALSVYLALCLVASESILIISVMWRRYNVGQFYYLGLLCEGLSLPWVVIRRCFAGRILRLLEQVVGKIWRLPKIGRFFAFQP